MNNKTISGMKCILCLFGLLALALPAHAASFDCAKASTKVERIICYSHAVSKLDEELNTAYKTALHDGTQAESIKQAQKRWLKVRNACSSADCLTQAYQDRISELTSPKNNTVRSDDSDGAYALLMSKNDEMCSHMRQLMNDDAKKFERTYDSHDRFVRDLDEFKSIPWKPAKASFEYNGKTIYTDIKVALFDLNNDGVQDFVVLDESMLSGMQADGLYMFDSSVASRANKLETKELNGSNNKIAMAGWFYELSAPLAGQSEPLWRLSPFVYHGISYLYMQSLYKKDEAIGGDFVVIAKYIGGKFLVREMTGKMEDICYIKRANVKTK